MPDSLQGLRPRAATGAGRRPGRIGRIGRAGQLALWVLCGLLLLAQSWSLWHRQLHGALTAPQRVLAQVHVATVADLAAPSAMASLAAELGHWFGGHEPGSADCTLLDQLLHAVAAGHTSPWLAQALPALDTAWQPGAWRRFGGHAAYLARAPPAA